MPITVFKGQDNQWYFHVKAANGEIVVQSEGYTRDEDAVRGYGALLRAVQRGVVTDLLKTMFEGWRLREESYVRGSESASAFGTYTKDACAAMIEAAGGDVPLGMFLDLASHWSNDIVSVAAHYGWQFKNDNGEITISTVPDAPSPLYHWDADAQRWVPPIDPEEDTAHGIADRTDAPADHNRSPLTDTGLS